MITCTKTERMTAAQHAALAEEEAQIRAFLASKRGGINRCQATQNQLEGVACDPLADRGKPAQRSNTPRRPKTSPRNRELKRAGEAVGVAFPTEIPTKTLIAVIAGALAAMRAGINDPLVFQANQGIGGNDVSVLEKRRIKEAHRGLASFFTSRIRLAHSGRVQEYFECIEVLNAYMGVWLEGQWIGEKGVPKGVLEAFNNFKRINLPFGQEGYHLTIEQAQEAPAPVVQEQEETPAFEVDLQAAFDACEVPSIEPEAQETPEAPAVQEVQEPRQPTPERLLSQYLGDTRLAVEYKGHLISAGLWQEIQGEKTTEDRLAMIDLCVTELESMAIMA